MDVKKLRSQAPSEPQSSPDDIGRLWANISHSLRASAEASYGKETRFQTYAAVCRKAYYVQERLTEGFKRGATSCRDERGNLVTDAQGVLRLWRHHFSTLLRGECDINSATKEDNEPTLIDDDGVEIQPTCHNEVRVAVQRFKSNKAAGPDGLHAYLFKARGDELVRSMHQLLYI